MHLIILEDKVYKVTKKQLLAILDKQAEINKKGYHRENDVDLDDYLESVKPSFKLLGPVMFDFRL